MKDDIYWGVVAIRRRKAIDNWLFLILFGFGVFIWYLISSYCTAARILLYNCIKTKLRISYIIGLLSSCATSLSLYICGNLLVHKLKKMRCQLSRCQIRHTSCDQSLKVTFLCAWFYLYWTLMSVSGVHTLFGHYIPVTFIWRINNSLYIYAPLELSILLFEPRNFYLDV